MLETQQYNEAPKLWVDLQKPLSVKYPHIIAGYTAVSAYIRTYLCIQVGNLPVTVQHSQHNNTHQ